MSAAYRSIRQGFIDLLKQLELRNNSARRMKPVVADVIKGK